MYNSNSVDNNSGMLTSRVIMAPSDKTSFIKKLLTNIVYPTFNVASSIHGKNINQSDVNLIMTVFSSVPIDADIFNLTILQENRSTIFFKKCYERNNFYMINSYPAINKRTNDLTIILEFYKNVLTEPMDFLDEIRSKNEEILGYLYLKELVSIAQKNYKNKFTLANKARLYMFEHNPNMDTAMRDEAAIALAKMAIEYHTNSMIIDNIDTNQSRANSSVTMNVINNIEYLKNCSFVLYDEQYNYKMSQYEILEKLLDDAVINFIDTSAPNNKNNNMPDNPTDDTMNNPANGQNLNENEQNIEPDENTQATHDDTNDKETSNEEDDDDNNTNISRDSAYTNRNIDSNNNDIDDDQGKFLEITFKSNSKKIFFMKMPPQKDNDAYDRLDSADESRIDQMQNYIDYGMQKIKGSGVQDILESIGCPIEVDMAWEEELIRYVNNMTNMTNSNKNIATWSKQNIFTRHIATLPGKQPIPESIPIIYIMFDQSGSMSNNIVRKINYIIEYFYNKKYDINVFIHDYAQSADEVNVYEFRPGINASYNDNHKLSDLISSRIKAGGTSHKGVFDLMEVYIKEVSNTTKKYNIQYCFICSDLESDIDQIYQKYEWIKLIDNNIFALTPTADVTLPFGRTIYIS